MNAELWARVKALFADLEDLPESERQQRLLASDEHPEVVHQVQKLLAAQSAAGSDFLEPEADAGGEVDQATGQLLGPFRLQRLIGEGGMGAVYLAQRVDVGGQAAVKLLRGRFASSGSMQRFEAEQRILARLDHPNIARLLQVGRGPDGTPWLAMEYVEGQPLNEVMPRLGIRERVRIFIRMLDALGYAHRQLVVHRDLKPSNVMVDARGEPRLLDFGIAKRLDEGATALTDAESGPRTPGYAAPEQIEGGPITVATDVYAMGVLIYECLCGQRPFAGRGLALQEAIVAGAPPLPSSRADPALRSQLRGDLDAIVLQAMRVDPAGRYTSAEALADDLRAYLAREPVRAQRQTFFYRSGKFLRRNAIAVSVAMLVMVMVGLAFLRENSLRAAAALEAEKSRQVADFMLELFDVGNALNPQFPLSKDATVLDLMQRGVDRVERLALAPQVRADLLHKFGEVYWGRSEYGPAEIMFSRAVALRQTELGRHTDTAESHLMLGRVFERSGRFQQALDESTHAYQMRLELLGPDHIDTVRAQLRVALPLVLLDRLDEAKLLLEASIAAFSRLLPGAELPLANSYTVLGQVLRRQGESEAALAAYRHAYEVRQRVLPPGHSLFGEALMNIAAVQYQLGEMGAARQSLQQAIEIDRQNFPGDHLDLVADHQWLAMAMIGEGDVAAADAVVAAGLAMAERLHAERPNIVMLDRMRQARAMLLRAQGQLEAARALQHEVLQSRLATLAPTDMYVSLARAVLADILWQLDDVAAPRELDAAIESWASQPLYNQLELATAMRRASSRGYCTWLDRAWPPRMAPAIAEAVEAAALTCQSAGPARAEASN